MLKLIIEALLMSLLVITVVTQIIIPAFSGQSFFWFFKNEVKPEPENSTLSDLSKEVDQVIKTKEKVSKVANQVKKIQDKIK